MDEERALLLLDACCVINLYATHQLLEILGALPYRCAAARYVVEKETLVLALEPDQPRESINLTPVIQPGLVTIMEIVTPKEKQEYVRFARQLDDGEAQTCALASAHQGIVATDDRKALRLLAQGQIPTLQTSELVHQWAHHSHPPTTLIRDAIRRIESMASFRPPRGAPYGEWWSNHRRESE